MEENNNNSNVNFEVISSKTSNANFKQKGHSFGKSVILPFFSGIVGCSVVIGTCFGVPSIKEKIIGENTNYVQTSVAEGTYAKKTELSAYATTESLGNYMQTSAADAKYATKSELGSYATTESLGAYMQTTTADGKYATKSELSSYATTDSLDSYMQTTTADGKYATKSELGSYATTASLSSYLQTSTADGKYATKTELGSYVKTVNLPKGVAVTDATSAEDVVQQLNALIASLENAGLIATS